MPSSVARPRILPLTMLAVAILAVGPVQGQAPTDVPRPAVPVGGPASGLPLEGTTWRLASYLVADQVRSAGPEMAAWVTLRAGRIRGSGGCNRISGRYARMGEAITIELGEVGGGTCAEQTMRVERSLIEGLERAIEAEVVTADDALASQLIIRDASRSERLRFSLDDAAALDLGEWRLEAYSSDGEMIEVEPEPPAVLAFRSSRDRAVRRRSSGEVVGSSGCNGLVGEFAREGAVLQVRPLEGTDAVCPPELEAQEAAMLAVLGSPMTVELPPDRLVLTSAESGAQLQLVASAPLEGSTWLVARIRGSRLPEGDITLRLEDGALDGEGPCGPYSGRYETNGIFISFSDVAGSGDVECAERAAERDLVAAIRSAVLIDRSAARPRLLDARGRTVVRLRQPTGP